MNQWHVRQPAPYTMTQTDLVNGLVRVLIPWKPSTWKRCHDKKQQISRTISYGWESHQMFNWVIRATKYWLNIQNWKCQNILHDFLFFCWYNLININAFEIINSLAPSDAIWWQKSGSTLAQVMACCLTAQSHYLNQCWLINTKVLWHPRALSWEDLKIHINKTRMKFEFLKSDPDLPGTNELILYSILCSWWPGTARRQCICSLSIYQIRLYASEQVTCISLTHWGRATHICVSKQTIIGSDNGLSPGRRQAM